jgi:hypothetical protein
MVLTDFSALLDPAAAWVPALLIGSLKGTLVLCAAALLSAVLRRKSSRGWLLAAAGADTADLVLTLTNAYPFSRRTRLLTLASMALYVMLQLYLAFDQDS